MGTKKPLTQEGFAVLCPQLAAEAARPAKKQERPGHGLHGTGRRPQTATGITELAGSASLRGAIAF
ncbi:hypothetical protein Ate02nite_39150 [Paractinoplanes tereljensis]|uniref:Uncharacterized protein n=1 Tax=Paractinoplanes tereljensis TaxID=571912 RepID=A0A919TUB7_9ACTN|nr:hypothetical protein Ate02nite_39150 [Actinoplanes tereljensis]